MTDIIRPSYYSFWHLQRHYIHSPEQLSKYDTFPCIKSDPDFWLFSFLAFRDCEGGSNFRRHSLNCKYKSRGTRFRHTSQKLTYDLVHSLLVLWLADDWFHGVARVDRGTSSQLYRETSHNSVMNTDTEEMTKQNTKMPPQWVQDLFRLPLNLHSPKVEKDFSLSHWLDIIASMVYDDLAPGNLLPPLISNLSLCFLMGIRVKQQDDQCKELNWSIY